jgi:dTDP-4-dehydrorhamnose reductase
MRVIIFGANGMLGTYLTKYLKNKRFVVPFGKNELDLVVENEHYILNFLKSHVDENDVIINAAGLIPQRNPSITNMIKVNSIFPHILARFKEEVGCEVIHITTDCVFDGKGEGEYLESEPHDCDDVYGKSKSLGENDALTMIRTSIIGEEKNNKLSLLEWVRSHKNGDEIDGYGNHYWNGVTCLELSKTIYEMIKKKIFWKGVRHMHTPDYGISKYTLVEIINEIYGLGLKIKLKNVEQHCNRTLRSLYVGGNSKKGIKEQIKELKEFKI